jgi:drug/metabolite transporter (DMT)-like permease
MLAVPLVAVFSGMLFLGESPGWPEYSALALVVGSLATVITPQRKQA